MPLAKEVSPFILNAARMRKPITTALSALLLLFISGAVAQTPYQSSGDFAKFATKLREQSLLDLEPQVIVPTEKNKAGTRSLYPWKQRIVTTVFWVGESAGQNNPVHNFSSCWDIAWCRSFGGCDNPNRNARRALPGGGSIAASFLPQQNPFYFALPYTDVMGGHHKSEAKFVVPWFRQVFEEDGKSVCRDRWIAIRRGTRVCYAQWSDCGPFRTDHHEYVFGNDRPKPNLNQGAGLDVSPAVRDYLGMGDTDVVDWQFVEYRDIPSGPWAMFGNNNSFVLESQRNQIRVAQDQKRSPKVRDILDDGPSVITK
jgi:hypothetical protein